MDYIDAKHIVNYTGKGWFNTTFTMNIYNGCSHGCIYCDSRSLCYQNGYFDKVKAKKNAIKIIEDDLKRKRKHGKICTGSMTDPYNHFEKKLKLTQKSLELINKYSFGVHIVTKSDLVVRDIDLLKEINIHSESSVSITITTSSDKVSKITEPNAPSSSKRFAAIKKLSDNGIFCGVLLCPILPFITDTVENINEIIDLAYKSGAKFISPGLCLSLKPGSRDYYFKVLSDLKPEIVSKYKKTYGFDYECCPRNFKQLWEAMLIKCKEYNLPYKMSDIEKDCKEYVKNKQLLLF